LRHHLEDFFLGTFLVEDVSELELHVFLRSGGWVYLCVVDDAELGMLGQHDFQLAILVLEVVDESVGRAAL
jgi:hypothetical protein